MRVCLCADAAGGMGAVPACHPRAARTCTHTHAWAAACLRAPAVPHPAHPPCTPAALPVPGAGKGCAGQQLAGPRVQAVRCHRPTARVQVCHSPRVWLWHLSTPGQEQGGQLPRARCAAGKGGLDARWLARSLPLVAHVARLWGHRGEVKGRGGWVCSHQNVQAHTSPTALQNGKRCPAHPACPAQPRCCAGTYSHDNLLKDSTRSTSPRAVFGTATRDGQSKVTSAAAH